MPPLLALLALLLLSGDIAYPLLQLVAVVILLLPLTSLRTYSPPLDDAMRGPWPQGERLLAPDNRGEDRNRVGLLSSSGLFFSTMLYGDPLWLPPLSGPSSEVGVCTIPRTC